MPRRRGQDEVRHVEPSEGTQPEDQPIDELASIRAGNGEPAGHTGKTSPKRGRGKTAKQRSSAQARKTRAGSNRDRKRTS